MIKTESKPRPQPKQLNLVSIIYGSIWIAVFIYSAIWAYPDFPFGIFFGIIVAAFGAIILKKNLYLSD